MLVLHIYNINYQSTPNLLLSHLWEGLINKNSGIMQKFKQGPFNYVYI